MSNSIVSNLTPSAPNGRQHGIDVLRGLAVILVVLHHIHLRLKINGYPVGELLPKAIERPLFWSGYYAVIAFFVISGFLITTMSLQRWRSLERIPLAQFYTLRAARILPCLLLLLATLSALHLLGAADFAIKPERTSLERAIFAALAFHINWLEGQRGYLPGNWDVLWSLSIEETFYIFFPLACLLLRRERLLLIGMLVLIVIGPINRLRLDGQQPWTDYAYLSCMDGIAFGCIAAWIRMRVNLNKTLLRALLPIGIAAILLIVVFRTLAVDLGLTKVALNVTVLEFGVALVLIAFASGVGEHTVATGTGLIRVAGRCSYEIYLAHMFMVLLFMHPIKALFGTTLTAVQYWTAYLSMLGASVLLGYGLARFYSEPLNRAVRQRYFAQLTPARVGMEHS